MALVEFLRPRPSMTLERVADHPDYQDFRFGEAGDDACWPTGR